MYLEKNGSFCKRYLPFTYLLDKGYDSPEIFVKQPGNFAENVSICGGVLRYNI